MFILVFEMVHEDGVCRPEVGEVASNWPGKRLGGDLARGIPDYPDNYWEGIS
jgi:hypothetical protein